MIRIEGIPIIEILKIIKQNTRRFDKAGRFYLKRI